MIGRQIGSHVEIFLHLFLVVDDVHGGAGEDVGRTDENGVAVVVRKLLGRLNRGQLGPLGLIHTDLVQHSAVFVAVFGRVDHLGVCSGDGHAGAVQGHREVVWNLPTERRDDALWRFEVDDVERSFQRHFLKVQPITFVKVCRHRLRIAVEHDGLLVVLPQRPHAPHRPEVELHRGSNPVGAAPKHEPTVFVKFDIVLRAMVCHVEVVGRGGELCCEGVDLFDPGSDAPLLSLVPDFHLRHTQPLGDLFVGESRALEIHPLELRDLFEFPVSGFLAEIAHDLELRQIPVVDLCEVVYVLNAHPVVDKGVGYGEDAFVRRRRQLLQQRILFILGTMWFESSEPRVDHADGLLHRLREFAGDRHNLSNGTHL
mmetsp:Transcript_70163/g.106137  ORF Transcript_70163/g.106137 Transcript_70163/m.106137 type:complete len:370 (-) Transcript_70163:618-1727(-)